MGNVIIGERLGKRIAEKGYTQQAFADLMGMRGDTLRAYINGKNAFSYELLIEFAEKLDCSYDYLLGYSNSPKREYHELTEQTRLSNEALEKLHKYAVYYDTDFEAKRYIGLLDLMIRKDGALRTIFDYLIASKLTHDMYKDFVNLGNESLKKHPFIQKADVENDYLMQLENMQLVHVVSMLKDLKREISQKSVDDIKKLDDYQNYEKEMKQIKANLGIEDNE